ncbi:MAG TPA: hypothetical protein VIP98_09910 [Microlunatus sp.]
MSPMAGIVTAGSRPLNGAPRRHQQVGRGCPTVLDLLINICPVVDAVDQQNAAFSIGYSCQSRES